jgi:hypothetical protein
MGSRVTLEKQGTRVSSIKNLLKFSTTIQRSRKLSISNFIDFFQVKFFTTLLSWSLTMGLSKITFERRVLRVTTNLVTFQNLIRRSTRIDFS